jgi:hypothetical protein
VDILPVWSGSGRANGEFSNGYNPFAVATRKNLLLPRVITKHFTLRLPMVNLFKSKRGTIFQPMEMMTKPLHLMYDVHKTLECWQLVWGRVTIPVLCQMITLLLLLLPIGPPVNAIAIA